MRKPWLIKIVFAAAVIFTVLFTVLAFAEVIQFFALEIPVNLLIAMLIADVVCPFILWKVYYSLTHDSLGNKIKPSAKPVYKKLYNIHRLEWADLSFQRTQFARKSEKLPNILNLI